MPSCNFSKGQSNNKSKHWNSCTWRSSKQQQCRTKTRDEC
jgi:hypothetical protein